MKLFLHVGKFGFSDVYTSLDKNIPDDLATFIDKDKPYIIFSMATGFHAITINKLKYIVESGLLKVGFLSSNNKTISITVNGYKNIINAIEFFFTAEHRDVVYVSQRNRDTYQSLEEFKQHCETALTLLNKPKKNLPNHSINISELCFNTIKREISANTTYEVSHTNSAGVTTKYIYKENKSKRSISDIEVFNSHCYRLLLGERHPNVMGVYNDAAECIGIISELIEPFQSFHDYYNQYNKRPSSQILLDSEVVKVWVAAYVEDENDLHGGNYYLASNGLCGKIDDDRSSWQHTAKYHAVHPVLGSPGIYNMCPPITSFKLSERDIISFPRLRDANPKNWPDRSDSGLLKYEDLLLEKKYHDDKFYMFLKRILVPANVYEQLAKATLRSTTLQSKLAHHKQDKTKELSSVLAQIPEFRDYVQNNQHIIDVICDEFDRFNINQENDSIHIDLDTVRAEFARISDIVANLMELKIETTALEQEKQTTQLPTEVAHANNNFNLFRQPGFLTKAGVVCLIISYAMQTIFESEKNTHQETSPYNLQLLITLMTTFSLFKDIFDTTRRYSTNNSPCNDSNMRCPATRLN